VGPLFSLRVRSAQCRLGSKNVTWSCGLLSQVTPPINVWWDPRHELTRSQGSHREGFVGRPSFAPFFYPVVWAAVCGSAFVDLAPRTSYSWRVAAPCCTPPYLAWYVKVLLGFSSLGLARPGAGHDIQATRLWPQQQKWTRTGRPCASLSQEFAFLFHFALALRPQV